MNFTLRGYNCAAEQHGRRFFLSRCEPAGAFRSRFADFLNLRERIRIDFRQCRAAGKCAFADGFQRIRQRDGGELRMTCECAFSDHRDRQSVDFLRNDRRLCAAA